MSKDEQDREGAFKCFWSYCSFIHACAQSCLALGDPMDCSPPGSSVHGVSQSRILERAEFSSSGGLSNPGIEPESPALVGGFFTSVPPGKPILVLCPCSVQLSSAQSLAVSDSLPPHGLQHARLPCPSPTLSLLKLMSIESVMPSSHLILCRPLLLLPSVFLSIRVFSNESTLHMRWPKYWSFSFSISPSKE